MELEDELKREDEERSKVTQIEGYSFSYTHWLLMISIFQFFVFFVVFVANQYFINKILNNLNLMIFNIIRKTTINIVGDAG